MLQKSLMQEQLQKKKSICMFAIQIHKLTEWFKLGETLKIIYF